MDCDGRVMCWSEYGLKSSFGWEIDHAIPTRLGGPDIVSNLRARHWQGNRSAGGILGNALRNMGRQRRWYLHILNFLRIFARENWQNIEPHAFKRFPKPGIPGTYIHMLVIAHFDDRLRFVFFCTSPFFGVKGLGGVFSIVFNVASRRSAVALSSGFDFLSLENSKFS